MNKRLKELAEQAGIHYRELCDEFATPNTDGVPFEMMERFAELVRQDERERMNGIVLTNIPHQWGNPVPDEVKLNPDSLEKIEIDIPVMPEDQLETWMYNMIRACNRSTSDSDINVIKLIQHIENLYMQGRADERDKCAQDYLQDCADAVEAARLEEREACARLCEKLDVDYATAGRCAFEIRQRGEK